MICLPTTCPMLSYNRSLEDGYQRESQRKSAHLS